MQTPDKLIDSVISVNNNTFSQHKSTTINKALNLLCIH
jgi:hypothetical protein